MFSERWPATAVRFFVASRVPDSIRAANLDRARHAMRGRNLDRDLARDLGRHVDCALGRQLDRDLDCHPDRDLGRYLDRDVGRHLDRTWIAIGVSRAPEEWSGPRPAAPTASDTRLPRAYLRFEHARPDVRRAAALPRQG
jgi:hypothetical protein